MTSYDIAWRVAIGIFVGFIVGKCAADELNGYKSVQVVPVKSTQPCVCSPEDTNEWAPESNFSQWISTCPGFTVMAGAELFGMGGWPSFNRFIEICMEDRGGREYVCPQILGMSHPLCSAWSREEDTDGRE